MAIDGYGLGIPLMKRIGHFLSAVIWGGALFSGSLDAADFAKDVRPILQRLCFECHGPQQQKGGFRLDRRAEALAGGENGRTIVPGEPANSEILRRLTLPRDDAETMPPRGLPPSRAEIRLIQEWIAAGAIWPEAIDDARHWAYVKPAKVPPPSIKPARAASTGSGEWTEEQWATWIRNPVDSFIGARLAQEGSHPSPEADRATLIRRLSFDLIGLPPSPQAVDAFVNDTDPAAYEALVERLLGSPEFGVKWARPWLDLARYADSHGFQRDDLRELWAYRDWVVSALNADMSFDRFTIEQLAGDLLPNPVVDQLIATGFHRCTPINVEAGSEPEESRINQVIDRVNTTGAVWLGSTLECAQCHDHKYDPFTQKDYYRLLAYFNDTEKEAERSDPKVPSSIRFIGPSLPLPDPSRDGARAALRAEIERLDRAIAAQTKSLQMTKQQSEPQTGNNPKATVEPADTKVVDSELVRIEEQRTDLKKQLASIDPGSTLVMKALDEPRSTSVFRRGDYRQPAEVVSAGTPVVLTPSASDKPNRLTLARWLVSPENPLTARVTINRWWAEIFGQGIVPTSEDFGLKGDPPTHPELLDWLALDFMENGWSMKQLLKTIVTSALYRQTSHAAPADLARDDRNVLYARGPRFRLDAETIRDNALSIAGLLSHAKGGTSIRPPQPEGLWNKVGGLRYDYVVDPGEKQYRRGLYVVLKRGSPYPSFVVFDGSARLACVVRRSRSNTPLQALAVLNDPVFVEAASAFARRIVSECRPGDLDARLDYAFRIALARNPAPEERILVRNLYERQLAAMTAAGAADERVGSVPLPEGVSRAELAAWCAVASALLNLDETITKG